MNPPFWPRLGGTFAIGLASLVATKATSAEPPIVVVPATYSEPAPPEPEIERFHGTVKIGQTAPPPPMMRPPIIEMTPPTEPIVQVEARSLPMPVPVVPDTRVSDAVGDTLHTVREDARRVSSAAAVLLGQVGGWLKAPRAEPRTMFPITITYPAPIAPPQPAYYPSVPPWLQPVPAALPTIPAMPSAPISTISASMPAATTASQQPTIIVIREPAPPAQVFAAPAPVPATAPVAAASSGVESYLGFGVGVIGLSIGLTSWFRTSRKKNAETQAGLPPAPASPPVDGVILAGGLYAGPRPELAEPFDLGPSYEAEQLEKKRLEEQNQNAVLEFILSQNLALQAAFAGPTGDETATEPAVPLLTAE